jgi:hypothetical protein
MTVAGPKHASTAAPVNFSVTTPRSITSTVSCISRPTSSVCLVFDMTTSASFAISRADISACVPLLCHVRCRPRNARTQGSEAFAACVQAWSARTGNIAAT